MATATVASGVIKVLTDENVGSSLITAPSEAWRACVATLSAGDADTQKMADVVTSMLRASNQSPQPGQSIDIELQGGTETEAVLSAILDSFPGEYEQEHGEYNRKTRTSKSSKATASTNGAAKTKSKKGTPKECACGCGEMTGGGIFRPGHDARHKGNLLKRIDEGGEDGEAALEELRKYPKLYNIKDAEARLGSGPAKKAAQAERLAKLKADKEAQVEDDEDEDEEDEEEEEEVVEEVKPKAKS